MPSVRTSGLVVLGAIVLLGGILRFANLWQRGFIYWDEGKFGLEGVRMLAIVRALTGGHWDATAGKTVGTAKPTHALLIGLSDGVFGIHDYSSLYMSALASLAAVVLIYFVGRAMFDPVVGTLAALFVSVSEYDVIYARSGLSEADGNALFLAGVLVWVTMRRPLGRFLAALLLGLAFTANYRLIVYFGVVVVLDVARTWMEESAPASVRSLAMWIAGFLGAPIAWQAVDVVARANGTVLFRSELTGRPMLYARQLIFQLHEGKQSVVHFSPFSYPQWYFWREGLAMSILIAIGIVVLLVSLRGPWERSWAPRTVLGLILIPYTVYVFAPFVVPRNLNATVPFACIAAAVGLTWMTRRVRSELISTVGTISAALVLAVVGTTMCWQLTSAHSGFVDAANFVEIHGGGRAVITNEIMVFYLRGSGPHCRIQFVPRFPSALRGDIAASYTLAAIDKYNRQADRYVRGAMPLVGQFPLGAEGASGEDLISSENGHGIDPNDTGDVVSIYRLVPSLLPPGAPTPPSACDRNAV